MDFFGTAFETYHVSRRAKRAGGGREMGAASAWCGNLTMGIKHCNWVQKCCYAGNASTRKFCDDNLLYLASRDGFFNNVFHRKCDLKGPTITIVALADGRIFGGYASTPWQAGTTGKYADDGSAFIFSLTNGPGGQPVKIGQADASPKDAVFHDSDLGPCFGRALGIQLGMLVSPLIVLYRTRVEFVDVILCVLCVYLMFSRTFITHPMQLATISDHWAVSFASCLLLSLCLCLCMHVCVDRFYLCMCTCMYA
jgi:hypothetical protein